MLSLIITSPPSIQEKKKKSPFCISFPWMFSCSLLLNISEIAPNIFLLEFSQIWFLGFRVQCRSLITQPPGVSLLCPCWGSSFVNLLFVVQNPLRFHIKRWSVVPETWHHWFWDWFFANHDKPWTKQNPVCLPCLVTPSI